MTTATERPRPLKSQKGKSQTKATERPRPLEDQGWAQRKGCFGIQLIAETGKLWPGILRCVRPSAPHDPQAKNAYMYNFMQLCISKSPGGWAQRKGCFGIQLITKTDKLWPGILRCVRPRAPHYPQAKKAYMHNFVQLCIFRSPESWAVG